VRVLLINDSSSNPNLGDRAAAYSLKTMIKEARGEITASVSELELGTSTFGRPAPAAPPAPQSRARYLLAQCAPPILHSARGRLARSLSSLSGNHVPVTWSGFSRAAQRCARGDGPWSDFLGAARNADIAVIHGDGCMMGDSLIARTELLMAYVLKKHLNMPVIIVNHTADFSDPSLREIAQEVYPMFDDVVFRDEMSVERCQTFCAGRFSPDTAFWFRPAPRDDWASLAGRPSYFDVWPDVAGFDPDKPYVCLGGSSVFGTRNGGAVLVDDYVDLVEHLRSLYLGQIVLVVSDLVDEPVLRPVAHRLGLPVVGLTIPLQQAVDIVGNADCYVGGRWHVAIFALSGGAPVVPLSAKTHKMSALTKMAGLPADPVDATQGCNRPTASRPSERGERTPREAARLVCDAS
jgi:polysaccharide pyruvyl transferase WcaK-like protein